MTEGDVGGGFQRTHRVPNEGLATWAVPDPAAAAGPRLDPGLEVQVLENLPNGWTHILCANGWSAWVDGRLLEHASVARPHLGLPAAVDPYLLAGAALALIGSVTPWLSLGKESLSSWQLPFLFVLTGRGGLPGIKAGPVLLVALLAAAAYLMWRSRVRVLLLVLAAGVSSLALGGLMLGLRTSLHAGFGVGLLLTLVGGLVLAADYARLRSSGKGAVTP
jgi:hypothetical protein